MTSGRDARRKPPRGTATPPLHLRRTAGGLPAAAPGTGPRQLPAVTFGLAELRRGGGHPPERHDPKAWQDHRRGRCASHVMTSGHPRR